MKNISLQIACKQTNKENGKSKIIKKVSNSAKILYYEKNFLISMSAIPPISKKKWTTTSH